MEIGLRTFFMEIELRTFLWKLATHELRTFLCKVGCPLSYGNWVSHFLWRLARS